MTTLTMKEEKRLEIIQRVFRGELTVVEAGVVIGVSERQCYRIKARVTKRGAKGVVHGNRGRPCKRKTKEKEVRRVVELAKGKYRGFNDHHLTEKLVEQEKLEISRETVRQISTLCGDRIPAKEAREQTSKPVGEKGGGGDDAAGGWITPRLAGRKRAVFVSDRGHR